MPTLIILAILVFFIAAVWRVFTKAGQPGWAALIPIYNMVVLTQVAGRPTWWVLLLFVPVVNIFVSLVLAIDIAKNFGKGTGFGFGLFLFGFIFYPILGFGDAEYVSA